MAKRGRPKAKTTISGRLATPTRRTTTVTFSSEDLTVLGRLIGAGQVMLQISAHRALAKLKAAMTRLGVPVPRRM